MNLYFKVYTIEADNSNNRFFCIFKTFYLSRNPVSNPQCRSCAWQCPTIRTELPQGMDDPKTGVRIFLFHPWAVLKAFVVLFIRTTPRFWSATFFQKTSFQTDIFLKKTFFQRRLFSKATFSDLSFYMIYRGWIKESKIICVNVAHFGAKYV
jgi:hypothetical protein